MPLDRRLRRTTLVAALAAAALVAVPLLGTAQGTSSAAAATTGSTKTGSSSARSGTSSGTGTSTTTARAASAAVSAPRYCALRPRATLTSATCAAAGVGTSADPATSSGTTAAPLGNVGAFTQSFVENFAVPAAANGPFAATYANSWQPYADGTSGIYYSGSQVSAHDGYMDVTLDGTHGAAGAFGTPNTAWARTGGRFSVRARAVGGTGNGAAFMIWPSSNTWSDGEIDYPESNFEDTPMLHQHSMTPGQEVNATSYATGASWRDWHTYSVEWIPGKSVKYYLDDSLVQTITQNVPTTAHRYMFQVGNWGATGHLEIDWVSIYSYAG